MCRRASLACASYSCGHRHTAASANPQQVSAAGTLMAWGLTTLVWAVVLLSILANLGVNITAFVASLGVGGIAIALAVQNILGDLFASVSIAVDKPFEVGDFIVRRADGLWAYQLAVVVDDIAQGMTDIVRGADLLVSTPRQLWLRQCLGGAPVTHCHLPVLTNAAGEKLSKQTLAPAIDAANVALQLRQALAWLGHPVPDDVQTRDEIWHWARQNWQLGRVPAGPIVLA